MPSKRARDIQKGAKQGPKITGTTKPPPGNKGFGGLNTKSAAGKPVKLLGKKGKKAAATAAAWALINNETEVKKKKQQMAGFAY